MTVELTTFGFKAGAPQRADVVFDVRSLPNPFYDPELRPLTGRDPAIARYFAAQERTEAELAAYRSSLHDELRRARERGDDRIRIAVGCTGGQHRSVYVAERLAEELRAAGVQVELVHRDLSRV